MEGNSGMVNIVDARRSHAWCLFRSLSQPYAVRLESVLEVVSVDRLVRFPLGPPELMGLCTIRRDVIPVIGLVDGRPAPVDAASGTTAVLILQAGQGTWGVGINREGIAVVDQSADTSAEPGAESAELEEGVAGIRKGDTIYTVIHTEQAWASVRTTVERWYSRFCPPALTAEPGLAELGPA
jgi:chemotaxis signal transduction protein